jgi:hypothetical protein
VQPVSTRTLTTTLDEGGSARTQEVALNCATVAGWTGRDPAALGGIRPVFGRALSHGYDIVERRA